MPNPVLELSVMPSHVVWFERLMYPSLLACLAGLILYGQRTEDELPLGGLIFLLAFIGIVVALLIVLIWLVARRRKSWARYAVCALYAVTVPHFLRQALVAFRSYPREDMLAWAQFVMLGVACALLFTRNARPWFAALPSAPSPRSQDVVRAQDG
jgi:Na+/proline symporter